MFGGRARQIWQSVLAALWIAAVVPGIAGAADLTVFAAASLKGAMDEAAERYTNETGTRVVVSYAASSALARQIQFGAPVDVFVSANSDWMDLLQREGRIDPDSRFDFVGNRLVLITYGKASSPVTLSPETDLAAMLGAGHLAMALVDAVPVGIYGRQALESLGLWDSVSAKVAQTDNARAALALVSSGETPFGIVYATDATADDTVSVVGIFPATTHSPVVYPVAAITPGQGAAAEFLGFLRQPQVIEIFERHGFINPAEVN